MEFANAMLIIKPYFDSDVDLSLELMDILNNLNTQINESKKNGQFFVLSTYTF